MSEPLVSIVLPTYNGARYIAQSINSCLTQTYGNLELIIVDGGSSDGTLDIIKEYDDPRLQLIHQPANSGKLPGALNIGFAAARGDLFTWTQDDDYFTPDAIAAMADFMAAQPEIGLVYTGFWVLDAHDNIIRPSADEQPDALIWTNPVGHCFLYRRETAAKAGIYDVNYFMVEDVEYWMRIYKVAKMARMPDFHGYYHRLQPASLTMSNYGRYLALRLAAAARRHHLGLGWWAYRRQVANAYIEEAFAALHARDRRRARQSAWRGIVYDPLWLRNRGVLTLALKP